MRPTRFLVEEDVVMRGDVLSFGVYPEVVLPDDVIEFFELGFTQRFEDREEVGIARNDIDAAARFEDALGLLDPFTAEIVVFVRGDLDVPVDDEIFFAVVVLMELVAVDTVGRIGDDEVDRFFVEMLLAACNAILVVKDVLVFHTAKLSLAEVTHLGR